MGRLAYAKTHKALFLTALCYFNILEDLELGPGGWHGGSFSGDRHFIYIYLAQSLIIITVISVSDPFHK